MKFKLLILTLLLGAGLDATAQVEYKLDKTVHDFGVALSSDGPLSCTFEVTNTGSEPFVITSVISSCGCTNVNWTREQIPSGGKAQINATYANEDGPNTFDKTLTVYVSDVKRPAILHLRGVIQGQKLPLKETFPVHMGPIAVLKSEYKVGNMDQGQTKSEELLVANIGKKPVTLSWQTDLPQLVFSPASIDIEPGKTASVTYSVRADRSLWGKNYYHAYPVINGKASELKLSFWAVTREDFSGVPKTQYAKHPGIDLPSWSAEIKCTTQDSTQQAVFTYKNTGPGKLVFYRIQPDDPRVTLRSDIPGKLVFDVNVAGLGKDTENLFVVNIYTNSPADPVVHLYINVVVL